MSIWSRDRSLEAPGTASTRSAVKERKRTPGTSVAWLSGPSSSGQPASDSLSWKRKRCVHSDASFCCSVAQLCPTLCDPVDCSTPGFSVYHHLSELAQTHSIELVMLFNHLVLCGPLLLLRSIFPSIRVFSNESTLCIRWPKYWSLSISPSNEYSWLISFRIDRFDLHALQGTLKNLLQYHSAKASTLWSSAFFMVLLMHLVCSYRFSRRLHPFALSRPSHSVVLSLVSLSSSLLSLIIVSVSTCFLSTHSGEALCYENAGGCGIFDADVT